MKKKLVTKQRSPATIKNPIGQFRGDAWFVEPKLRYSGILMRASLTASGASFIAKAEGCTWKISMLRRTVPLHYYGTWTCDGDTQDCECRLLPDGAGYFLVGRSVVEDGGITHWFCELLPISENLIR